MSVIRELILKENKRNVFWVLDLIVLLQYKIYCVHKNYVLVSYLLK